MVYSLQSPWKENGMIPVDVINWLLEPENPSMKYRTMKELLDESQNEVKESILVRGGRC